MRPAAAQPIPPLIALGNQDKERYLGERLGALRHR